MNPDRFAAITGRYQQLRIALVGDFCLDRYFEIDPARSEISIETGLPVHNVVGIRSQPGAAGTILNNLCGLGVGEIHAVGFCGDDGEGYELRRALGRRPGVNLSEFQTAPDRRTFTYGKPLVLEPGKPPVELNRLDTKNWTPTPPALSAALSRSVTALAKEVDAVILMDQVDLPESGVVTQSVREAAAAAQELRPKLWVVADSRRGLGDFPPMTFKMNAAELAALLGEAAQEGERRASGAARLSRRTGHPAFVTLAGEGILAGLPDGATLRAGAHPVRGAIDIVGAGDAVTANLVAALSAGASAAEAMELAMCAASCVIHQLGTTGEAGISDLARLASAAAAPA